MLLRLMGECHNKRLPVSGQLKEGKKMVPSSTLFQEKLPTDPCPSGTCPNISQSPSCMFQALFKLLPLFWVSKRVKLFRGPLKIPVWIPPGQGVPNMGLEPPSLLREGLCTLISLPLVHYCAGGSFPNLTMSLPLLSLLTSLFKISLVA